jgi:protein-tyrosine phosphatase
MKIDLHSHLLPKADHGCQGIEDSLKQLNTAKKNGIETIVATPHFYPFNDSINVFLSRREKAYEDICKVNDTGVKIILGAEVRLTANLYSLRGIKKLAISGTDCILLEMPRRTWDNTILDAVLKIQSIYELNVIIAHIERYPKKEAMKLFDLGVLAQINAYSLYNLASRHTIMEYIRKGYIQFIGSDSHIYNTSIAYRCLGMSLKNMGRYTDKMMDNASKILSL